MSKLSETKDEYYKFTDLLDMYKEYQYQCIEEGRLKDLYDWSGEGIEDFIKGI